MAELKILETPIDVIETKKRKRENTKTKEKEPKKKKIKDEQVAKVKQVEANRETIDPKNEEFADDVTSNILSLVSGFVD